MLGSLAGLRRLRGSRGFCSIHRICQACKNPMPFFGLPFQICGPPAPGNAVRHWLAFHPRVQRILGSCREEWSCFSFETASGRYIPFCASPGKTSSALSPHPITGPGEAVGLWLGSAWWWPEVSLPPLAGLYPCLQAWLWPSAWGLRA